MEFQHTVVFTKPRKNFRIKTMRDAHLFIKGFRGTEDFEVVVPDYYDPNQCYYIVRRNNQLLFGRWAFMPNSEPLPDEELAQRVFEARDSINVIFK